MIKITTKQIKAYQVGEISINDLAIDVLNNNSAIEVAKALVELMAETNVTKPEKTNVSKVSVSKEDLDKIINMFKVKVTRKGRSKMLETEVG